MAILLFYWYWYGPYIYQKVLILVLAILLEPKSIEYFSAIFFSKIQTSLHGTGITETSS